MRCVTLCPPYPFHNFSTAPRKMCFPNMYRKNIVLIIPSFARDRRMKGPQSGIIHSPFLCQKIEISFVKVSSRKCILKGRKLYEGLMYLYYNLLCFFFYKKRACTSFLSPGDFLVTFGSFLFSFLLLDSSSVESLSFISFLASSHHALSESFGVC